QDPCKRVPKLSYGFAVVADYFFKALGQIDIAKEPDQTVQQEILHRCIKVELNLAGDLVVERVDFAVQFNQIVAVADRGKGGGDSRRSGPGLVGNTHNHRCPTAVYHRIRQLGCNDLAPQPVYMQRVRITLRHFPGELTHEVAAQVGVV